MTKTELKRVFDYLKVANDDILGTIELYRKRQERFIGNPKFDLYQNRIDALFECKGKIFEAIEELAKAQ